MRIINKSTRILAASAVALLLTAGMGVGANAATVTQTSHAKTVKNVGDTPSNITFDNQSWTDAVGKLSYTENGQNYSFSTDILGLNESQQEYVPGDATDIVITFYATDSSHTQYYANTFALSPLVSWHQYKVTGTLFGHWYYMDGVQVG